MNISIRQDSYAGVILKQALNIILPISEQWFYIPFDAPLFLLAGHYYVRYDPIVVAASKSQWGRTVDWGVQDCYVYALPGGWAAQSFNLTLKVHMKNPIDPESVNMKVANQVVLNQTTGMGWANVTAPITGTTLNFAVSSDIPLVYSYLVSTTSFRVSQATSEVSLMTGNANWTLTAFSYPGVNYSVYQANITGFNTNHTLIQAFWGVEAVGYSRPPPYTKLSFNSPVDRITFESTNYVTSVEIPTEVHSNQDVNLNVTVGDLGNISVIIYSGTGPVPGCEYKAYACGMSSFPWLVATNLPAGEYTFEATFFMPNHVGFFQQNITILKVAAIETYNLSVQALGTLKLNFRLFDPYDVPGSHIEEANVTYHLIDEGQTIDLTGSLQQSVTGNHTRNINLDTFSFYPGNYKLFLEAAKTGYQSILEEMNVEVVTRAMTFEITRSATSLTAGSTLDVTLRIKDGLTGDNVLRPVDITIKIYPAGGNPDTDAIATVTLESETSSETTSLAIPATAALGAYDILVRVDSGFYMGTQVYNSGLTIVNPPDILIYFYYGLVVAGVVVAGAGTFVQRKRVQSKRSVGGALIMNPGGVLLSRRIAADFSTMDPHLISGAVMGIVTMVREITGSSIRTIALESRFITIVPRKAFWLVLLLKKNPAWISGTIKKLTDDIELRYGSAIEAWQGNGNIPISIDLSLKRWFGIEITDVREPELEMGGDSNRGNPPNEG